jgi:hypothetical protein
MNTEALIRQLAAELQPVRPLERPVVRFVGWALFAVAWVVAGVGAVGMRRDFAAVLRDPRFLVQVALPLALGAAAAIAAFVASVPDRKNRFFDLVSVEILALWLLVFVSAIVATGGGNLGAGAACVRNLVVFSLPPGALLYVMLKRAAPLGGGATGLQAALGVAALGYAGTRVVCHNDGALHVLVWHCAFVMLLGGVGMLIGRALFR